MTLDYDVCSYGVLSVLSYCNFFFFKQKTAYEMRISDWSSDVCSSDLMVAVVLADLSAAFDPLSSVTFRFDRLETNPRFATIARPANAAIVARLRVDMEDRGGRFELQIGRAHV